MNLRLYDKALQRFLQSDITIKCDKKVLKAGRLKLFNIKQYFIKFYIETDKKELKTLELPYPFDIRFTSSGCTLNYHLSTLCNKHQPTIDILKAQKTDSSFRMYDNIISIIYR